MFTRPRPEDLSRLDTVASPSAEGPPPLGKEEGSNGGTGPGHGNLPSNQDVSSNSPEPEPERGTFKKKALRLLGNSLRKRQKQKIEDEPRPMYPSDGLLPPERKNALTFRLKKVNIKTSNYGYMLSLLCVPGYN